MLLITLALLGLGSLAQDQTPGAQLPHRQGDRQHHPWSFRSTPLVDLIRPLLLRAIWTPERLNGLMDEVEGEVIMSGGPPTALQELHAAEELSMERLGCRLPRHADAVNELVHAAWGDADLRPKGRRLLAALVGRCLVDHGARWIDWRDYADAEDPAAVDAMDNELVAGTSLIPLVAHVGGFGDFTLSPAHVIHDPLRQAKGRIIFVGMDRRALRAAARDARAPLVSLLRDAPTVDALITFCETAPSNTELRCAVYRHLITRHRAAEVRTIAEHFLARPAGTGTDAVMLACLIKHDDERPSQAMHQLQEIIEYWPEEPGLWVLLAEAHETRGSRRDTAVAHAYFTRALASADGRLAMTALSGQRRTEAR